MLPDPTRCIDLRSYRRNASYTHCRLFPYPRALLHFDLLCIDRLRLVIAYRVPGQDVGTPTSGVARASYQRKCSGKLPYHAIKVGLDLWSPKYRR